MPMIQWTLCTIFFLESIPNSHSQKKEEDSYACYDREWTYHHHTHTCIKFIQSTLTQIWRQSERNCEKFVIGNKKAHLMVITDNQTNSFVKDKILPSPNKGIYAWIGLSKTDDIWHWQDFSKQVTFINWASSSQSGRYAFIVSGRGTWHTETGNEGLSRYICQHDAVPRTQVKCPSPIRENRKMTEPMVCLFIFENATEARWESIRFGDYSKMKWRQRFNDDKPHHYVTHNESGYITAKYQDSVDVTREWNDEWVCSITLETRQLSNKRCFISVFEPAADIECESRSLPDTITISCRTAKIYPKAKCKYWYRWNKTAEFQQLTSAQHRVTYNHKSTGKRFSAEYVMSTCSFTLVPSNRMAIHAGKLEVKVQMYPYFNKFDLTDNNDAVREKSQNVIIGRPDKPIFISMQGEVNSSITVLEEEQLALSCEVKNGEPNVKATTIACEFPVWNSNVKKWIMAGNSSKMSAEVTTDINGKTCTCWGSHITGSTENTTVVIYVTQKGNGSTNGTEAGSRHIETEDMGGLNLILAVAIGVVVAIVCVSLVTVFCVRRRKGRKVEMETKHPEETHNEAVSPDFSQNAKAIANGQVRMDEEAVLFINDIYHTGGGPIENSVKDYDEVVACNKEGDDYKNENTYANTSVRPNNTPEADGKTTTSDVSKGTAKQRSRANDLVYVEIEFNKSTRGPERKVKIMSPEDPKAEYACIDFQKTAE